MQDLRGRTLGRYRLVTELGAGGMGTVYYAEHVGIGRRAAIKVLDPALSSNEDLVERFFTEARSVNALRHPHIVDIVDLAHEDGLHFLVMELLEGETLGARLEREKRLSLPALLDIVEPIASALAAAHQRGMVHRDLKPENVFLARDGAGPERAKLLDFGIVKLADSAAQGPMRTQAGTLLGTPAYMSPEQCAGMVELDARSDVYSLGVLVYEALSGRLPFVRNNVLGLLSAHQCEPPLPLARIEPSVPEPVSDAVMRALAKQPDGRFGGVFGLTEAMRRGMSAARPVAATVVVEKKKAQSRSVGGKISQIVAQRIAQGTMVIPSMPDACADCAAQLRRPKVRIKDIAERVRRDPMLSGRLLNVASSIAMGARERITDVETALVRLGTETTLATVIEMAARQVFVSRDPALRTRLRKIWERSIAISLAAGALNDAVGASARRGSAQTAGLIAEIGQPILAGLLLDVERSQKAAGITESSWLDDDVFASVVAEHGLAVGAKVAAEWALDPELAEVITSCDAYDSEGGSSSLRNLVRMAGQIAAMAGYLGPGQRGADLDVVEEGRAILGLDPADEARIAMALSSQVAAQIGGSTSVGKPTSGTRVQRPTRQTA